jgi:diguanylate cyclase (GGDEF)-like protein
LAENIVSDEPGKDDRRSQAAPAAPPDGFDPPAEAVKIAELLLRSAARLVANADQRTLVAGLCEALTQMTPNILLAWTWFGPISQRPIVPQIIAGRASAYAQALSIDENEITRQGPVFRALAEGSTEPVTISATSSFEPWRRAVVDHGIRTALALPLPSATPGQRGVFVLYADRPKYFESVGISMFEALAELFGALLSAAGARSALELAAYSDALTGLGNRHMLGPIERSLYRLNEATPTSAVLLLDLDHFKEINDHFGHQAGDQVLQELAGQLRSLLRGNDAVLRWGGEEFLVCLPNTTCEQALAVAEKIRSEVEKSRYVNGRVLLTISVGVADLDVNVPLPKAIEHADAGLYEAKRDGRNCVRSASKPQT